MKDFNLIFIFILFFKSFTLFLVILGTGATQDDEEDSDGSGLF
jgi:hypothetical protein